MLDFIIYFWKYGSSTHLVFAKLLVFYRYLNDMFLWSFLDKVLLLESRISVVHRIICTNVVMISVQHRKYKFCIYVANNVHLPQKVTVVICHYRGSFLNHKSKLLWLLFFTYVCVQLSTLFCCCWKNNCNELFEWFTGRQSKDNCVPCLMKYSILAFHGLQQLPIWKLSP